MWSSEGRRRSVTICSCTSSPRRSGCWIRDVPWFSATRPASLSGRGWPEERLAHRADSWGGEGRWEAGSGGWAAAWAAGDGNDMGIVGVGRTNRMLRSAGRLTLAVGMLLMAAGSAVAGWEAGTKLGFDSNVGRSIQGGKSDAYLLAYAGFNREPSGESRGAWV